MEYKGSLEVERLDPVGYCVRLGMDTPNQPVMICAELGDKEFLKFIRQELLNRRLGHVYYGRLDLIQPYDCPRTSCHDKGRAYTED